MSMFLYRDPTAIFPLFPEGSIEELNAIAAELIRKSSFLANAINSGVRDEIAKIVLPMNGYYSNLIEGVKTHPLDLERALKGDYSNEPRKRDLQLLAYAHMEVGRKLPALISNSGARIATWEFVCSLHNRFYEMLPDSLHYYESHSGERTEMRPGKFREIPVEVGNHIAPHPDAIKNYFNLFEEAYSPEKIKEPLKKIIAAAASHHRLLWIHPFPDGNGRVARLFSEAFFIAAGADSGGLWSISRGLSRERPEYYDRLHNADQKRLSNYDGRGNLSDKGLYEFVKFFLDLAIDQVNFMTGLLQLDKLESRLEKMVELMYAKGIVKPEAIYILKAALAHGKIRKGDVERLTGKSENTARALMNRLLELELLSTDTSDFKAPLHFHIPVRAIPYLLPDLYPADIEMTIPMPGED